MKYLITGIEGFVGGYLAEELVKTNNEVFGTYFLEDTLLEVVRDKCRLKHIDITDKESVYKYISEVKPDVIFHLAAQSSAAASWKRPQLTMEININGSINLMEAVKASFKDTRIVLIGSSEEYGIVPKEDNPISEELILRPNNPYAVSKAACESLGKLYNKAYNMDIVMARSFNHIGIRQSEQFVISDFSKRIAEISTGKREPVFEVGNLDAERDFTDVRDVIRAYIIISEKGNNGEIYNVGSGTARSIKHYLNYMIEREKLNIEIVNDESRMRPSDNPVLCCDNTKLKKLGWSLSNNIYDTIDGMIDYWKYR